MSAVSYKRRKLANGNPGECECEDEVKIVIQQLITCIQTSMLQITEQASFTAVRLNHIDAHLNRLDTQMSKLTKEISDLQIHALYGMGRTEAESAPYTHF
jgi:hypothetical protein